MTKVVKLAILLASFAVFSDSAGIQKAKLNFKVAGRNLLDKDDIGKSDPYYIVSYSDDGGNSKTKIGRSDTITDQDNPDWGNLFQMDFDRSKDQYLYFHVWDEDTLREDDTLGRVWINVADYVDKGQLDTANLDKGGYIIVQSPDASLASSGSARGSLPLPPGTPEAQTLRFRISASGLPKKDDIGFIPVKGDPYAIVKISEGVSGSEKQIGRTSTASSTTNPSWSDVFTIQWSKAKDQRLHFKLYDDDTLRTDDKLGQGWIDVNDYVAHGQSFTLILPKKGTLTMSKA